MPKLVIFDLDNTLTESRTAIPIDTAVLLRELLKQTKVAVISGAAFWQFEKELLKPLAATESELANLFILTTSGAELWIYENSWKRLYAERLSRRDKSRVREALMQVLVVDKAGLEPLLDDRDSGMTYSALGKDAPPDLKSPWDPDQKKRRVLVEKLSPLLSGLELKIGGTTSIDITNIGIDKSFGVRKIIEYTKVEKDSVVFIGDALFPEGNDSPVNNIGIKTISTKGPSDTRSIMKNILEAPDSIDASEIYFRDKPAVFISAEYALEDNSLSYAGGLGVLAADFLYQTADDNFPTIFLGLWYSKNKNEKKYSIVTKNDSPLVVEIPFEQSVIMGRLYARRFGKNWLILIEPDTDLGEIYATGDYMRIKQDLVLGMGAAKVVEILHLSPAIYHINEGHAAFAAFELVAANAASRPDKSIAKAMKDVGKHIVATKHTIFSHAGAKIEEADFNRYFGSYCEKLGISTLDFFNTGIDPENRVFSVTHFLLNASVRENAVSILHAKFEKNVHPKSNLIPITNGVYRDRWLSREWGNTPQKLADDEFLKTKSILRARLIDYVNSKTGSKLNPDVCTVVWARRFTSYKRPETIISDIIRLKKIGTSSQPLQFIISGNIYQHEADAQKILDQIISLTNDPEWQNIIAYVPDYSISVSHLLVSGADIWLNTPFRGKEACGTSGMKSGQNGALQMSISDGWIEEVKWKNIGWILPEQNTADAVYNFLEKEVAPLFYENKKEWINRMKKTMSIVEGNFTAKRMLRDYIKKLYKI
jgi:starch phosphorylase